MSSPGQFAQRWSDELGWRLLASLTDQELAEQCGGLGPPKDGLGRGAPSRLRHELLALARQDEEVRRWMVHSWRRAHPEIIRATRNQSIEDLAGECGLLLHCFDADDISLVLISDENDDGWDLVETFVRHLRSEEQRRVFQKSLHRLASNARVTPERVANVVIIGGHPHDERNLGRRFGEQSPFAIRWKVFEKKQGGPTVAKMVTDALASADAAILVMGMVSHTLVRVVKRHAQRYGIRWHCVHKATESQLTTALCELFPDVGCDPLSETSLPRA